TAHRRESFGQPLRDIFAALRELAGRFKDQIDIVYPVHPNPQVSGPAQELLAGVDNIVLLPPLDYVTFVHLMQRAFFILTDSGGVQEEAPSLGKPVLVMRAVTERPEGIAAGTAALVGVERDAIVAAATTLLTDRAAYQRMAQAVNPYGDGKASQRIVEALLAYEEHLDHRCFAGL
ncbi:MAG: UDP-N-acetylglucosamine 2-epimerase (non-hydrolyzing), partial [Chloroflexi bacterium]|nr:UDP-N-acetylglucosamine 2-epimerase (non-hydrolyzing) [Chloroflexota bacterium]